MCTNRRTGACANAAILALPSIQKAASSFSGETSVEGSHGGSSKWLMLLVGLVASSLALIKANFAPLVNVSQVRQLREKVSDNILSKLGVILAALGIYWLLRGWLFFGLLVSGTITAAGLFAGSDTLVALGVIKPAVAEKLKPFGTIIGLACAAAAIVQLLTGGLLGII